MITTCAASIQAPNLILFSIIVPHVHLFFAFIHLQRDLGHGTEEYPLEACARGCKQRDYSTFAIRKIGDDISDNTPGSPMWGQTFMCYCGAASNQASQLPDDDISSYQCKHDNKLALYHLEGLRSKPPLVHSHGQMQKQNTMLKLPLCTPHLTMTAQGSSNLRPKFVGNVRIMNPIVFPCVMSMIGMGAP